MVTHWPRGLQIEHGPRISSYRADWGKKKKLKDHFSIRTRDREVYWNSLYSTEKKRWRPHM